MRDVVSDEEKENEIMTEATATIQPIRLTPTLPAAFTPVAEGFPTADKRVLGIRESSTGGSKFEVMTVKWMPDYRPHNPWQTLGNDAVTDSGNPILGWLDLDDTDFGADWLNG